MNTKYYAAIAATVLTLGLTAATAHADQPINVRVNGDVVDFVGQQPLEQDGSVLVPLRGVFEKLGADVEYDSSTRSIMAVRGKTTVSLQLGSRDAQINDTHRRLSVPAQAVNGSTLVPLRFVSEALGAQVDWRAPSRTVVVSTTGGDMPLPPRGGGMVPPRDGGGTAPDNRLTYGHIAFNWDWNGFSVRDRAALETQIRQDLKADPGSRFLERRDGSGGTLEVNVSFKRVEGNNVQANVHLGLDKTGRGGSEITAAESAITPTRGDSFNEQVVLQAFRKARREFTTNVNEYVRNNR